MRESLRAVESSQKKTFKSKQDNRKIQDSENSKNINLDLLVEHDKLSADIILKDQEISALKSQLIAARTSHQEAEALWKQITTENNNLKASIRNFEQIISQQKEEISILKNSRDKLSNLLGDMLRIHIKTDSVIENISFDNQNLQQQINKNQKPTIVIGDQVNVSDLTISILNPELKNQLNFIKSQTQYTSMQQIQAIINTLVKNYNNIENSNKILKDNLDALTENYNLQANELTIAKQTVNIIKTEWKKIISAEANLDKKAFITYNDSVLKSLGRILPNIQDYPDDTLESIKNSEYYNIIEALVASNLHLENQLEAANIALDEKDNFDSIIQTLGVSDINDAPKMINELQNKIQDYHNKEEILNKQLSDAQALIEKSKTDMIVNSDQISSSTHENELLRIKINDLENKLKVKQDELMLKDSENINVQVTIRREFDIERNNALKSKDFEIKSLKNTIENLQSEISAAKLEVKQEYQTIINDLKDQLNILQSKYKILNNKLIEESKLSSDRIKHLKRKYKDQIAGLINANMHQREIFEAAAKKMQAKSAQETQLTEKLTQALQDCNSRNRELLSQLQYTT
ncbi:hypothetical protein TVAG_178800 [Trichomonas vaginalis G3]|uniref:Uncharacterized protein n=1 Tax=Trichomonas vaginalis (strain ATCC PRA-98 / G3) TaxID=412133 RepID=A2FR51_TRIV3|nr:hypothetical protein TVAGG3_0231870 [Trichomonas vaginalis G3]EAX92603.1 hypothetical protein TVAG_178800 [Trichomonas vaginalis G3]KAI5552694.1 hypothetical protein TVAGG3_0231870 [Trichomonas vaginalis G3]|eukprot:XP_001305533.1 hypothetical protein [Trichomonas vaginalis G3]